MSRHRHQSSLEGVLDFAAQAPSPFATDDERAQAVARFYAIVNHFDAMEPNTPGRYKRPVLIKTTYEYARSPASQDKFLAFFFTSLGVGMLDDDKPIPYSDLGDALYDVAEFLMTNFFLPCKYLCSLSLLHKKPADKPPVRASAHKTPKPSPAQHSALQKVLSLEEEQRMEDFTATPDRIEALRTSCLERDRHRCVVTRAFHRQEAQTRIVRDGRNHARDDDGHLLATNPRFAHLEVAHIIPYGLTKADDKGSLPEGRKAAVAILNMFDMGVAHLLEGVDINRPYNAVTLNHEMHHDFGNFKIYFQHVSGSTYFIDTFVESFLVEGVPVTRELFTHAAIDPPSQRLLALHCAIGHILHLSGAGEYIERILRDMELGFVCEDGSTQLGLMVQLAMSAHGWW